MDVSRGFTGKRKQSYIHYQTGSLSLSLSGGVLILKVKLTTGIVLLAAPVKQHFSVLQSDWIAVYAAKGTTQCRPDLLDLSASVRARQQDQI